MLLHDVAETYEVLPHVLQIASVDDRLRRLRPLACVEHCLGHFALFLEDRKPTGVEFFPSLETLGVFLFVVTN